MAYPEAYHKLIRVDNAADAIYRFCPVCKTCFFCMDEPQEYGSAITLWNHHTLFTRTVALFGATARGQWILQPRHEEVTQIMKLIPRHQLIFALYRLHHKAPKAFEQFIPVIIMELNHQDDIHWWALIEGLLHWSWPQRIKSGKQILYINKRTIQTTCEEDAGLLWANTNRWISRSFRRK